LQLILLHYHPLDVLGVPLEFLARNVAQADLVADLLVDKVAWAPVVQAKCR
jgi:hypothetical protein